MWIIETIYPFDAWLIVIYEWVNFFNQKNPIWEKYLSNLALIFQFSHFFRKKSLTVKYHKSRVRFLFWVSFTAILHTGWSGIRKNRKILFFVRFSFLSVSHLAPCSRIYHNHPYTKYLHFSPMHVKLSIAFKINLCLVAMPAMNIHLSVRIYA